MTGFRKRDNKWGGPPSRETGTTSRKPNSGSASNSILALCFATSAMFLTYRMTLTAWEHRDRHVGPTLTSQDREELQSVSSSTRKLRGSSKTPTTNGGVITSVEGVVARPADRIQRTKKPKRYFHTAMTCNGSPYTKWQSRIMYFYYKKYKDHPDSEMGGFTRVQHSGQPDNIMHEVPSFVVDPLPDDKDYVVLNRPWAFVQWLQKAKIEEDYIFMAEPDHIIVKPIPNLATEEMPAAFPFFYITPKEEEKFLRPYYPEEKGPITNVDPIGNSPAIVKKDDLKRIAPLWMNLSIAMISDPVTRKQFDWVLEMYAYATASALLGYSHVLRRDFMIHPPWDTQVDDKYIIHYTYGQDFDLDGKVMPGKVGPWHFDKRDYQGAPPRNLSYPPKGSAPAVFELIRRINEATYTMEWEEGAM